MSPSDEDASADPANHDEILGDLRESIRSQSEPDQTEQSDTQSSSSPQSVPDKASGSGDNTDSEVWDDVWEPETDTLFSQETSTEPAQPNQREHTDAETGIDGDTEPDTETNPPDITQQTEQATEDNDSILGDLADRLNTNRTDGTSSDQTTPSPENHGRTGDESSQVKGSPETTQTESKNEETPPRSDRLEPLLEEIALGDQILVRGSLSDSRTESLCTRILNEVGSNCQNMLLVTVTESATHRLENCCGQQVDLPPNIGVISIGSDTDISEQSAITSFGNQSTTIETKTLADPSDISRLGILATNILEDWNTEQGHTVVCFHSLSAMLQYTDVQSLFQFLHIFKNRLTGIDLVGHYHIDPSIHDEATIATFHPIFDSIVNIDDSGVSLE